MNDQITPLTAKRWLAARLEAEKMIRKSIREPKRADFRTRDAAHPPIVTLLITMAMIIVTLSAFYLSAAKEIVASEAIQKALTGQSERLGPNYIAPAILALFALAEVGVLLFGAGASSAKKQATRTMLRGFQVVCVAIALGANISVTLVHPAPTMQAFDWLMTIFPPVIVIGVGLMLEAEMMEYIHRRSEASDKYAEALAIYSEQVNDPQAHPGWKKTWGDCVIDQLKDASKDNREHLQGMLDANPRLRAELFWREVNRHSSDYSLQPVETPPETPGMGETSHDNSDELPETTETPREVALRLIISDPSLMSVSLADLQHRYGISRSTFDRAKDMYSANGHEEPVP